MDVVAGAQGVPHSASMISVVRSHWRHRRSSLGASLALTLVAAPLFTGCFLIDDYTLLPEPQDETTPAATPGDGDSIVDPSSGNTGDDPTADAVRTAAIPSSAPPAEAPIPPIDPPTSGTLPGTEAPEEAAAAPAPTGSATPEEPDAGASPPAPEPDAAAPGEPAPVPAPPDPAPLDAGGAAVPDAAPSEPVVEAGPEATCDTGWGFNPDLGSCTSDCAANEVRGPNGRCYWFGTSAQTFYAAQSTCTNRADGWSMVSVRSAEDDAFIQEQIVADTWLGASDSQAPNTWRWLDDGTQFWSGAENGSAINGAYTNWGNGEPSASSDESCARYHGSSGSWRWSDNECSEAYRPACEGPAPVEPTWSRGGGTSGGWTGTGTGTGTGFAQ